MITINFFTDGCYIKGHDIIEICSVVSYSHYALTNDMLLANNEQSGDITHYASVHDSQWSNLGFMYIQFDPAREGRLELFNNFKGNIVHWVESEYPNRVAIKYADHAINWEDALLDAKREQGYIA